MIMSLFGMTSCVTPEELTYSDVYISASVNYPVRWINSLPYYWFEGHWTLVPTYRYRYIRPLDRPRHFVAPRPRPNHYNYRYYPSQPRPGIGGPHTPQPRPDMRPHNHNQDRGHSNRHNNNGNRGGHFGGRR